MTQPACRPIRQFDETPGRAPELSTPLRELPWSAHPHVLNLDRATLPEERALYIETCRDVAIVSALLRRLPWTHHLAMPGWRNGVLVGAAPDGNATDES